MKKFENFISHRQRNSNTKTLSDDHFKNAILFDDGSAMGLIDNGTIKSKNENKRIVITTPVHQRFLLSKIYTEYLTTHLMPSLRNSGYDVVLLLCGDELEKKELDFYIHDYSNILFLKHINVLGEKKNLLLKTAISILADYVLLIDSDDLFHSDTCIELIKKADINGYWSSIKEFIFFDAQKKCYGRFTGYPKNHILLNWGMGSGRVFTSKLIDKLPETPFPSRNDRMDDNIRKHLQQQKIPFTDRLLEYTQYLPIGIKTDTNIWSFNSYKLQPLDHNLECISWIPEYLKSELFNLY